MQFSKQLVQLQNLFDNLQKCVICSKWIAHSSKPSIHVNESVSVIKMKGPDTIVYEQDSQMALSCYHYDRLFSNAKKSDLGDTIPENAQDSTIYTHLKDY